MVLAIVFMYAMVLLLIPLIGLPLYAMAAGDKQRAADEALLAQQLLQQVAEADTTATPSDTPRPAGVIAPADEPTSPLATAV